MLKSIFYIWISLVLSVLIFNSCTIIGFGVGSIIDAKKSDTHYTVNEELYEISPETELKIITVTNDTLIGMYNKTTNEYSDDYVLEYSNKYEEIRKQFHIPEINDTLYISNPMGNLYKYTFLGFDFKKIYVRSAQSGNELFINLNSNVKIKVIDEEYLNQEFLNNGFEYRLIPIMSIIHLENKLGSQSVFYHNIHNIQTDSSNRTRYLTLIGLTIDIFLISKMDHGPDPGGGPFFDWD